MIKITDVQIQSNELGIDQSRFVAIVISDATIHYALSVGDLPLTGDLQPILDTREAELWQVAVAKGNQRTTRQVRRLVYNSQRAGGWDRDEFQEAWFEERAGDSTKANILHARRVAIRAEWPL